MALALARQNIDSLVIEQQPSTTQHPRARGVNIRTMELFRQWGNAPELLNSELPKEARRIIWCTSLRGEEIMRVKMDDSNILQYSPVQSSLVSQDLVEQSLYHTLLHQKNAQVEFQKKCITIQQNDNGVIATVLDLKNKKEETISARFLIAADGANSAIRSKLDISMKGSGNLGQFCSVYCEMDLSKWTFDRPAIGFCFTDEKLSNLYLASVDGSKRWIIGLRFKDGNTKDDFPDDFCINEIRKMLQMEDLTVKILDKNFWTMAAQIAERYRQGRIFLVGDAAHRLPPTGGFGMNTGIQDAHNLAWKLAFMIKYPLQDSLLDSYQDERSPIAVQNIDWSQDNAKRYAEIYRAVHAKDNVRLKELLEDQQRNLNYPGLDLGFIYHSSIICSENEQKLSINPEQYVPTSLPGSRAPHGRVIKNDVFISTLDLFERNFVLLVGPKGKEWTLYQPSLFPVDIYKIGTDLLDPDDLWSKEYAMSVEGAVLVRPDGHIAWRSLSMPKDAPKVLEQVLKACVGQPF
ncbi:MAG: 4-methyl-5-nitrocatechol 5-monooxygenase [Chlamydiales bacterium]|nr:4-methyl-5-nitrocatechol 5-monooxygenase [Chlamydiales bacterium]